MYIGSVKFYKRLIIFIIFLLIFLILSASLYFKNQITILQSENKKFALENKKLTDELVDYKSKEEKAKPSFDYQLLYPELKVQAPKSFTQTQNTVYLTFDDGPSQVTASILDILKEKNIKATFFVVYKDDTSSIALYKRIVEEGHTIGVHSTTHRYTEVYENIEAFLNDFSPISNLIEKETGIKPNIFRFPGGSINTYNKLIYQELIAEMLRRGYTYYDWNVSSCDTRGPQTVESLYNNVIQGVHKQNTSIVLMHDSNGHYNNILVLPHIIDTLQSEGYNLQPLTNQVKPIVFSYTD